jgi:hypothetical protein
MSKDPSLKTRLPNEHSINNRAAGWLNEYQSDAQNHSTKQANHFQKSPPALNYP